MSRVVGWAGAFLNRRPWKSPFNSRKVSGGGTLLGDLARLTCRIRLLWGERDDSPFRPAHLLIGEIREAVGRSMCTGFPEPATGPRTRTPPTSIA